MAPTDARVLREIVKGSFTWQLEDTIKEWNSSKTVGWMKDRSLEDQQYFVSKAQAELNRREYGI